MECSQFFIKFDRSASNKVPVKLVAPDIFQEAVGLLVFVVQLKLYLSYPSNL